jgi:restriction endonuclease BamHI
MKWLRTIIIFDQGDVISSSDWASVHQSFVWSIESIIHPPGSNSFKIRKKSEYRADNGKKKTDRNGVNYLRSEFLKYMVTKEGWKSEGLVELAKTRPQVNTKLYPSLEDYQEPITSRFGGFDFATTAPNGTKIAIEWETGNISSSHRSLNKLSIALASGILQVGVLVIPSRLLYEHLTDRIGNIGELSGYLSFWESIKVTVPRGLLAISVVEHDELTDDPNVPLNRPGLAGGYLV